MTHDSPEPAFARIGDPDWLKAHGLFVAEGRHVTRRLLQAPGFQARAILVTSAALDAIGDVLSSIDASKRPEILERSQSELDRLTGFRLHQGCVAIAPRVAVPGALPRDLDGPVIVLERVRDPDNVGSMVRSAAALGAAGILLGPECADPYYRKAVRTSMGAVFTLPIAVAEVWPGALDDLRAQGRMLVAMAPDPEARSLREVLRHQPGRSVALLLGSEADGLTAGARARAHVVARIPMTSDVDSLNVSVAAAVALYEATGGME